MTMRRVEAPLRPEFNPQIFGGYLGEVVPCSLSQHRAQEQAGTTLVLYQSLGLCRSRLQACERGSCRAAFVSPGPPDKDADRIPYGACALLLQAGGWDEGVAP